VHGPRALLFDQGVHEPAEGVYGRDHLSESRKRHEGRHVDRQALMMTIGGTGPNDIIAAVIGSRCLLPKEQIPAIDFDIDLDSRDMGSSFVRGRFPLARSPDGGPARRQIAPERSWKAHVRLVERDREMRSA
jgi:hypothetical protein